LSFTVYSTVFSYKDIFYICNPRDLKIIAMKRAAIVIVVLFTAGLILSSCNKEVCPAYSQVDTEQTDPNG
jgi:hypothetical protein